MPASCQLSAGTYRLTRSYDGPPPYLSEEFTSDDAGSLMFPSGDVYRWTDDLGGRYEKIAGSHGPVYLDILMLAFATDLVGEPVEPPSAGFVELDYTNWTASTPGTVDVRLGTWSKVE